MERLERSPMSFDGATAYRRLCKVDRVLRALIGLHGTPDPFECPDYDIAAGVRFDAVTLHVLRHHSNRSQALPLFDRLPRPPDGQLSCISLTTLGVKGLLDLGVSRPGAVCLIDLAERVADGSLDLERLDEVSDEAAVAALTAVRGIGPVMAQRFLVGHLNRCDVLAAEDHAIRRAVQREWHLPDLPSAKDVAMRASYWSPYRSYAAAVLRLSMESHRTDSDSCPDRRKASATRPQRPPAPSGQAWVDRPTRIRNCPITGQ